MTRSGLTAVIDTALTDWELMRQTTPAAIPGVAVYVAQAVLAYLEDEQ